MSKFLITHDMFRISERVKKIDKDYFILFNNKNNKFEVHHKNQRGGTYCLTCPYDRLDSRLLDYVLRTSSNNSVLLMKEIEKHNYELEKNSEQNRNDYVNNSLKQIYDYASVSSKTINYKDIMNTKWIWGEMMYGSKENIKIEC